MLKRILLFLFFITIVFHTQESTDIIPISKEKITFIKTSDSIKQIKKFIKETLSQDTLAYIVANKLFFQRAVDEGNYKNQYYATYRLGYFYNRISDYVQSIRYSKLALKAAYETQKTSSIINSSLLYAGNYSSLGLYDEALKQYLKIKDFCEETHTTAFDLIIISSIARVKVSMKKYNQAIVDLNTVLNILHRKSPNEVRGYWQTFFSTMLEKGQSLKKLGALEDSLQTYNTALQLAKKRELIEFIIVLQLSIGNTYYYKKDYVLAEKFLTEAKNNISSKYQTYDTSLLNYFFAQCYTAQHKYNDAIALLKTNFNTAKHKKNMDRLQEMYELRIQIAKKANDLKTITIYQEKINQLIKSENEKRLRTVELLHGNDLKKLEKQNDQSNNEKRIAFAVSLTLLVFLLFSMIYFRRKSKLKAKRFEVVIAKLSEEKHQKITPAIKNENTIKDSRAYEILKKLSQLEQTDFFKSKECTLYTTAKAIQTNTTYLSKTLNEVKKQSFNQYLNELRINYVLIKLQKDTRFRAYTVKAISEEMGYKSVTTFLRAFKAKTNLNPSYYIEKLNNSN